MYNFKDNNIYNVNNCDNILIKCAKEQTKGNNKKIFYYNFPCAFDIETSSFYRLNDKIYTYKEIENFDKKTKLEKLSTMYIWQFGINGYIIIGRTWQEFIILYNKLVKFLQLSLNKRLIIYVHNLSYEFQFIRKLIEWENIFSIELRKPLYCLSKEGLEFRCSYLLSGYSLNYVAKNLQKYKCEKLIGNLDYHLIRHSETPLNKKELEYCINDVKIVMLYILEYIENRKNNIQNIPLTKTGAVREYIRKECFTKKIDGKNRKNYKYIELIKELEIKSLREFNTLQRAFAGGFTHANPNYVNKTLLDVTSYDFTSSYPAVMISEYYPMSSAIEVNIKNKEQFKYYLNNFCCVFDIQFIEIFTKETFENYISVSKCFIKENAVDNNGRLVCASKIALTITNIDFNIIEKMYNFKSFKVGLLYAYKKAYLPTEFVKSILKLYESKTKLKDVKGSEVEYLNSKEMLNSCYGMCVTSPLRDEICYINSDWKQTELDDEKKQEQLLKQNFSESRFLFYAWGVFVTAYARRNLFTAILNIKNDYIYSDTDSVKIINFERHKEYFELYNKHIEEKLKKACNFHKLDFNLCKPKNIKGKEKILGIWDFDGQYKRFKTLGAKRYMVMYDNALEVDNKKYNVSLTVAGVNKKTAIPYLLEKYKDDIFNKFDNNLIIPTTATGKNICTYIDYHTKGFIKDYLGNLNVFSELSSIHLEPCEYNLSLSIQFLDYLININNK